MRGLDMLRERPRPVQAARAPDHHRHRAPRGGAAEPRHARQGARTQLASASAGGLSLPRPTRSLETLGGSHLSGLSDAGVQAQAGGCRCGRGADEVLQVQRRGAHGPGLPGGCGGGDGQVA